MRWDAQHPGYAQALATMVNDIGASRVLELLAHVTREQAEQSVIQRERPSIQRAYTQQSAMLAQTAAKLPRIPHQQR